MSLEHTFYSEEVDEGNILLDFEGRIVHNSGRNHLLQVKKLLWGSQDKHDPTIPMADASQLLTTSP